MTDGYLYCFSNQAMPGILKVGMTEQTPDMSLFEANCSVIPMPYKIEFAKKVLNSKKKETTLHNLLSKYKEKINDNFFRVSPEEVKEFVDLIDGELWVKCPEEEHEDEEDNQTTISKSPVEKCRDIRKYFKDGQQIRHTIAIKDKNLVALIGNSSTWIGIYDSSKNGIIYDGKMYQGRSSPLHNFAKNHYENLRPDRGSSVNAWDECEYEENGKWISTKDLN